ncbi:MAG: hypothetical protein KDM64_01170 [Verrucomicrobiae bacterium]|nr:hypothetical protein [Verrucomicrobiae bacterium]
MKHHTAHRSRRQERGSILVICMVMAGVGAIGAAAFFSLVQAKSQESLERETAMTRRTRLANSRAVAKDALLRVHLGSPTAPAGGSQTITLPGGWGEAVIASHSTAPLAASTSMRLNKTGTTPSQAFTEDISITLSDGDSTLTYQAQAKSYSPGLGSDLLVVQRPTGTGTGLTQFTGNLLVKGRAVFSNGSYSTSTSALKADRVMLANHTTPKLSLLSTDGSAIIPENGTLPATTSGLVNSEPTFNGQANLIGNPDSPINDYVDYVQNNGGTSLTANSPYVTTEGLSTIPAGVNDTTLIGIISALVSPLPNTLATTLRPYRPLSSQVLTALIAQSTAADATVLTSILVENTPLPSDVLQQIANGTAPLNATQAMYVFQSNPVGAAVTSTGTAYFDLDSSALNHIAINGGVTSLILQGQEDTTAYTNAAALNPLVIAINETGATALSSISIVGQNNRPLILALRKTGNFAAPTVTFSGTPAFPNWRSLFELEGVAINVSTSGVSAATLVGGIRTDRSINVTAGTLTLSPETSVTALQGIAARDAWLELVSLP